MRSHQTEILEKIGNKSYGGLSFDFAFSLTNESDRGGILIGTGKVEDFLEQLLLTLIPRSSKSYKSRLFDYPGPMSSLSGKIELLYAFRIIDQTLYNSLTALRKIRNQAAHSTDTFSLETISEQLKLVFLFEENFPQVIAHLAYENLIKSKLMQIKEAFEKSDFKDVDYQKIWEEEYPNPKENESIQQQLRVWELSYAMTFLCLKIEAVADDYKALQSNRLTWAEIMVENTSLSQV